MPPIGTGLPTWRWHSVRRGEKSFGIFRTRAKSNSQERFPGPGVTSHLPAEVSAQRIDWGEALEGSARELMAVEQMDAAGEAVEDAETFLADLLRDGPMATREIKVAARAHGHTWRTVERAKKSLSVVAVKGGFGEGGGWSWELPKTAPAEHEDRQQDETWRS